MLDLGRYCWYGDDGVSRCGENRDVMIRGLYVGFGLIRSEVATISIILRPISEIRP